jgi:hypothetical protein
MSAQVLRNIMKYINENAPPSTCIQGDGVNRRNSKTLEELAYIYLIQKRQRKGKRYTPYRMKTLRKHIAT